MAAIKFVFALLLLVVAFASAAESDEKMETSRTIGLGFYNRGFPFGAPGYGAHLGAPYSPGYGYGGYPYYGHAYGRYGFGYGYYPYNGFY